MIDISAEALDLVRGGLHSLKAGGQEGHTGECYWTTDGCKRCGWGHIIGAAHPGHAIDEFDVATFRMSWREIDDAYEKLHDHSIDWASEEGYAYAVASLEALLLAAIAADDRVEVRTA